EALEQKLLLAGDVVIDGGLGDAQSGSDVVERGVVEAAFVERTRGGADHGLALHFVVARAPAAAGPWRGPVRVGGRLGAALGFIHRGLRRGGRRGPVDRPSAADHTLR